MKDRSTLEIEVLLNDRALSYGSTPIQALELGDHHADKFELRSGELVLKSTGKAPTRAEMEKQFPVQIPSEAAAMSLQDRLDKAFLGRGNLGMRAALKKEVGDEQLNTYAKQYGLKSWADPSPGRNANDTGQKKAAASSPWSKAGWNISEQGRLVRAIGIERAAGIAKASGCTLGSTKWNPAYN
jgi:hypothetical protein